MSKPLVFICSRYAGDIEKNVATAKTLCRMAIAAGYVPFAPHLFFTRFLDDGNPGERDKGREFALRMMDRCDLVWVYTGDGVSDGMVGEVEYADHRERPVVITTKLEEDV